MMEDKRNMLAGLSFDMHGYKQELCHQYVCSYSVDFNDKPQNLWTFYFGDCLYFRTNVWGSFVYFNKDVWYFLTSSVSIMNLWKGRL